MSSVVSRCPFGCASTQNELLMFKEMTINYFDKIMVKFNDQDIVMNDLVRKLDECLNFNYQNGYGDHSISYQANYNNAPVVDEVNNEEIICFRTDDIEAKYSDVGEPLEEDSCQSMPQSSESRGAIECIQDESISDPVQENDFLTRLQLQTIPIPLKTGSSETSASSARRSSNFPKKPTFSHHGSGMVESGPSIDGMTSMEIRNKYSTGGDDEPMKCKLCRKEFPWNVNTSSFRTSNFVSHVKRFHRASGKSASVYGPMKKQSAMRLKKGLTRGELNVGQPKIEAMAVAQSQNKQSAAVEHNNATYPNKRQGGKCNAAIKIKSSRTGGIQQRGDAVVGKEGAFDSGMAGSRPNIDGMTTIEIRNKYSTGDATEPIKCKLCQREFRWNPLCDPSTRTTNFVSHIRKIHRASGKYKRKKYGGRKTASQVRKNDSSTEESDDDDSQSVKSPGQSAPQESEFSADLGMVEANDIPPSLEQDIKIFGNESSRQGRSIVEASTTACSTSSNSTKSSTRMTNRIESDS